MSYLDQFEEKPQSLVFNGGVAGIARACAVVVSKRGKDEPETRPVYKLEVFDPEQQANSSDSIPVYPVNKGFYYKGNWDKSLSDSENKAAGNHKSEAAERFAVNELRHLLKIVNHPTTKNDKEVDTIIPQRPVKNFNDFMDYTFEFMAKAIKEDKTLMFDVAVAYGNEKFPNDFLQLEGYPWYIDIAGSKISLRNDAITERPKKDSEGETETSSTDEGSFWTN